MQHYPSQLLLVGAAIAAAVIWLLVVGTRLVGEFLSQLVRECVPNPVLGAMIMAVLISFGVLQFVKRR